MNSLTQFLVLLACCICNSDLVLIKLQGTLVCGRFLLVPSGYAKVDLGESVDRPLNVSTMPDADFTVEASHPTFDVGLIVTHSCGACSRVRRVKCKRVFLALNTEAVMKELNGHLGNINLKMRANQETVDCPNDFEPNGLC